MRRSIYTLGLAYKAGKITYTEEKNMKALSTGKGRLIILARDASGRAKKRYYNKSRYYGVHIVEMGAKKELGEAIGKSPRSALVCLDEGFACLLIGDGDSARTFL